MSQRATVRARSMRSITIIVTMLLSACGGELKESAASDEEVVDTLGASADQKIYRQLDVPDAAIDSGC